MTDSQARREIAELRTAYQVLARVQDRAIDRIEDQRKTIADQQTVINLLMGFLGIEAHEVPEVPAVAAVPAHLSVRKVVRGK